MTGRRVLVASLNPSIDAEWRTAKPVVEREKNEIVSEARRPGGKGVNVARWLHWLGCPPRLFATLGGEIGEELAHGLTEEGIAVDRFPLGHDNRVNLVVTGPSGEQYRFNPVWQRMARDRAVRMKASVLSALENTDLACFSGTLPSGASVNTYRWLIASARKLGILTVLDCDGAPFRLGVQSRPWLVKPNQPELADWSGRSLSAVCEEKRAAAALGKVTGGWVLVSRGPKDAWLINSVERMAWEATPAVLNAKNTVGAGDAALAGCIAAWAQGLEPDEWLRWAVAAGSSATQAALGSLPGRVVFQRLLRATKSHQAQGFF